MKQPTRWRDDPAFRDWAGSALDAEEEITAEAVDGIDLGAMRGRILNGGPPVGTTGSTWLPWIGGIAVVGVVVAGLWVGASVPEAGVVLPPTAAEVELHVDGERWVATRTEEGLEGSEEDEVVAARGRLGQPPVPFDAETTGSAAAPVVEEPAGREPAEPSPPVAGGLRAEMASYNSGLEALEAGRWADALVGYETYLEHYPAGSLREAARLGRLTASIRSGNSERTLSLVNRMLGDPSLSVRHDELRRVRLEALADLGRCDEALAGLEGRRLGEFGAGIRKRCRRARSSGD